MFIQPCVYKELRPVCMGFLFEFKYSLASIRSTSLRLDLLLAPHYRLLVSANCKPTLIGVHAGYFKGPAIVNPFHN